MKQTKGQVAIIGGSIAGLAAGLALLNKGWNVNIFEATEEKLDQRGAGIITNTALVDALKALNIPNYSEVGVSIQTRKIFAQAGNVSHELVLPQIATSWGRLYKLLLQQFPDKHYHQGKELLSFIQHNNKVSAFFSDRTEQTIDLMIAADGIRSTIRTQLEPSAVPEYAGYVAWRGLIDEKDFSTTERNELFEYFTFCLPDGEQFLTYPIAGADHQINQGHRRCNVVWYRPAASDSTLIELLTDADGNYNSVSIAPNKVRPEVIKLMQNDAARLLSPQHTNIINKLEQPFLQPIYDLITSTMAHNRVAIIGDAAYTARPHLAAGVTKALDDALALADALERNASVPTAVKNFDKTRRQTNIDFVNRSRELGAYLQAQLLSEKEQKFAELHRNDDAVLLETANLQH